MANPGKAEKYPQIAEAIKAYIADNHLSDGMAIPPERILSKHFNCSHLTIRKALQILQQQQLIYTIPSKGNYVGTMPVSSAVDDTRTVGFLVPDDEIYYYELMAKLQGIFEELDLHPIFHITGGRQERETELLAYFQSHRPAALICVPDPRCLEKYKQLYFPIISFDRKLELPDCVNILSDEYGGALRAIQHLLQLGHRRIAFIGYGDNSLPRPQAWYDALKQFGITPEDNYLQLRSATRDWGFSAARELWKLPQRPTAVFCANDTIAAGVMRFAMRSGIAIPQELSVVGFGDTPIAEDLDLCSVNQESGKLADAIADSLRSIFAGHFLSSTLLLPTTLILRSSAGCPCHS